MLLSGRLWITKVAASARDGLVSERAIARLVNYLESMAAYGDTDIVAAGAQRRSRYTYYQIARSIGMTDEECVRLFKQLRPAFTYQRGLITLCDRDHLRALSAEPPHAPDAK